MTASEVTAAAIKALSTKEKLRLAAQLIEDGHEDTAKLVVDLALLEMATKAVEELVCTVTTVTP